MILNFLSAQKVFLLVAFCSLLYKESNAQNKDYIYLIGENVLQVEVLEITTKKIKYKDENAKTSTVSTEEVMLIFNKVGGFMQFPKKDLNPYNAAEFVRSVQFPKADFILTLDKKLIAAHIITKNEHEVTYENLELPNGEQTLSLDLLAMIIFKNGKHELFVSPSQAAGVLSHVASLIKLYNDNNTKNETISSKPHPSVNASGNAEAKEKKDENKVSPKIIAEKSENLKELPASKEKEKKDKEGKNKDAQKKDFNANGPKEHGDKNKAIGNQNSTQNSESVRIKMDSAGYLTTEGMLVFNKTATQKVLDLGLLLARISDKSTDEESTNKAIDDACKLFVNEDARVEVSDNNDVAYKVRFKIRDFLNRAKTLKYSNIQILWTNVNYVSNLQKNVDGSYSGLITMQEKIQISPSGMSRYSNQTKKEMEIVLNNLSTVDNGKALENWGVVLSDIGIVISK